MASTDLDGGLGRTLAPGLAPMRRPMAALRSTAAALDEACESCAAEREGGLPRGWLLSEALCSEVQLMGDALATLGAAALTVFGILLLL